MNQKFILSMLGIDPKSIPSNEQIAGVFVELAKIPARFSELEAQVKRNAESLDAIRAHLGIAPATEIAIVEGQAELALVEQEN